MPHPAELGTRKVRAVLRRAPVESLLVSLFLLT